ncbi:hypothetical protein AK812_SmicGene30357 [Symbiodinium microadriaticum]|uniref:Uncharacterized protein n=1 Tax=Symbiodinium microadriaticum TaxID=2951 RepID=A0A1Q9CZE2_SYMMI|nr:hypothetical protein AK812_SmicGene30357 [Symbiodinium microadriaticum]
MWRFVSRVHIFREVKPPIFTIEAPCPGTPVVDGRQARVVAPALPMQRVRTPSPAVTGLIAGRMQAHDGTAPTNGSASMKPCTGR